MASASPSQPNLLEHFPAVGPASGAPWWAKVILTIAALGIAGGIGYSFRLLSSVSKAFAVATPESGASIVQQLKQLIAPPNKPLAGESADRINILLLGMGGEGHDGALLTDTMMVASIRPSTGAVGLFSIPRDLIVNIPGHEYRKINFANALGEDKKIPGSGAVFASQVMEQVIGQPINYFVRVDFSGFSKLIDDIGGIDIAVDQSFTDISYPTNNYGYQTIKFTAGKQHMDGETALTFVRSRHGNNGEGSDFARSKRQQKVLLAVKEKLFSFQTLLNPPAVSRALTTLGTHIQMNFQPWELLKLSNMARGIDANAVHHRVLDTTEQGLLIAATGLDGAYILQPQLGIGKYADIQQAFATLLDGQVLAAETREPAKVELQNGTPVVGLAARTERLLQNLPVTVVKIGNAGRRDAARTVVYDRHPGKNPSALAALKNALRADVAIDVPAGISANVSAVNGSTAAAIDDTVDFIVLIGLDQTNTEQRDPQAPGL